MRHFFITVLLSMSFLSSSFCKQSNDTPFSSTELEQALKLAQKQSISMAQSLIEDRDKLPRSINEEGDLQTSASRWWTSGFFPGTLWYLYENFKDETTRTYAEEFTNRLKKEQFMTHNHDIGFVMYCSYGNGYRITGNESYKDILLQSAKSLTTRYRPIPNCIRSWDFKKELWQYPVIIDNMMNLELLMWASKNSNIPTFSSIARSHADKTRDNHFRPDYSCFHVVSYDTITGNVEKKTTFQGISDQSAWARGQGWALYGFTMMYRETNDSSYLNLAHNVAQFILEHPRLPEDKVPYWDFDDPKIPGTYRDASAAAIFASALIELSLYSDVPTADRYVKTVSTILRTLSSPKYLAKVGSNCNFILKHSVGNLPVNVEIDVPLTYADYYYVEALLRYKKYVLKETQD